MYTNVKKGAATMDKNVYAAIAMALYEFAGNYHHSAEADNVGCQVRDNDKETITDIK